MADREAELQQQSDSLRDQLEEVTRALIRVRRKVLEETLAEVEKADLPKLKIGLLRQLLAALVASGKRAMFEAELTNRLQTATKQLEEELRFRGLRDGLRMKKQPVNQLRKSDEADPAETVEALHGFLTAFDKIKDRELRQRVAAALKVDFQEYVEDYRSALVKYIGQLLIQAQQGATAEARRQAFDTFTTMVGERSYDWERLGIRIRVDEGYDLLMIGYVAEPEPGQFLGARFYEITLMGRDTEALKPQLREMTIETLALAQRHRVQAVSDAKVLVAFIKACCRYLGIKDPAKLVRERLYARLLELSLA